MQQAVKCHPAAGVLYVQQQDGTRYVTAPPTYGIGQLRHSRLTHLISYPRYLVYNTLGTARAASLVLLRFGRCFEKSSSYWYHGYSFIFDFEIPYPGKP